MGSGFSLREPRNDKRCVMKVDINCDMGEGFGPWRMGDDEGMHNW